MVTGRNRTRHFRGQHIAGVFTRLHVEHQVEPQHGEQEGGAGGNEGVGSTPEEFDRVFRDDIVKFAKIIADAKIPKLDN